MASISIVGKVTCKEGTAPVNLKTFDNGNQVANFSVVDLEYFSVPEGQDRPGQFYSVELYGKSAEIYADRLQRGDRVGIHGQLVLRQYQDKIYPTIKNARVTHQEPRRDDGGGAVPTARSGGGRSTSSRGGGRGYSNQEIPF
jgi:single-stranded DNA-binding protein